MAIKDIGRFPPPRVSESAEDAVTPISASSWKHHRDKIATRFDLECHEVARDFIALQARELRVMMDQAAGEVSQLAMNQMAQSIRKMQDVGRKAMGETADRQGDLFSGLNVNVSMDLKGSHGP